MFMLSSKILLRLKNSSFKNNILLNNLAEIQKKVENKVSQQECFRVFEKLILKWTIGINKKLLSILLSVR